MTTVTITTKYGSVSVSDEMDDMTISDFVERVLIPALYATYEPANVDAWVRCDG